MSENEPNWSAWESWLEESHPQVYDRWLDAGAMCDFHPGWEHATKEWLIDEEHPELWQAFQRGDNERQGS